MTGRTPNVQGQGPSPHEGPKTRPPLATSKKGEAEQVRSTGGQVPKALEKKTPFSFLTGLPLVRNITGYFSERSEKKEIIRNLVSGIREPQTSNAVKNLLDKLSISDLKLLEKFNQYGMHLSSLINLPRFFLALKANNPDLTQSLFDKTEEWLQQIDHIKQQRPTPPSHKDVIKLMDLHSQIHTLLSQCEEKLEPLSKTFMDMTFNIKSKVLPENVPKQESSLEETPSEEDLVQKDRYIDSILESVAKESPENPKLPQVLLPFIENYTNQQLSFLDKANPKLLISLLENKSLNKIFLKPTILFFLLDFTQNLASRLDAQSMAKLAQFFLKLDAKSPDLAKQLMGPTDHWLDLIDKINNQRPRFPSNEMKEQLITAHFSILNILRNLPEAFDRFAKIFSEIVGEVQDGATAINSQILAENVLTFIDSEEKEIPYLAPRNPSPFSLLQEFHVQTPILEKSDQEIDFKGHLEVYFTHPRTLETTTIRLPLPIEGPMTQTMVREQLFVLQSMFMRRNAFNTAYKQTHLDPAQGDDLRKRFNLFCDWAEERLAEALADFNGSDTFPERGFSLRTAEMTRFLDQPLSANAAYLAMSQRSLFRLDDGRLSLLPQVNPQINKNNFLNASTIRKETLIQCQKAILENSTKPVRFNAITKVTERSFSDSEGTIQFNSNVVKKRETSFVELKTTLRIGQKEITRTTLYPIEGKETREQTLQRVFDSGLLERDLLLTRCEFQDQHCVVEKV